MYFNWIILFVLMISKTRTFFKTLGRMAWNVFFIPGIIVAVIQILFIGTFAKVIQLEQRKTEMLVYLMEERIARQPGIIQDRRFW